MNNINEEEFILDIKVEDTVMEISNNCKLSPVYEIEDIDCNSSTIPATQTIKSSSSPIKATEIDFQQKRLRVFIKKLPQKVVDKYLPKNNIKIQNMTPSRTSTRSRIVPAKYRFPNTNKTPQPTTSKQKSTSTLITAQAKPVNHPNKSKGISMNSNTISKPTKEKSPSSKNAKQTENNTNCVSTVNVGSSKILVIKQPILKNDPLNIPIMEKKFPNKDLEEKNNSNENEDKELQTETDEETEDGISSSTGSEIVERIYFTNKSIQTKFTCNGNICGIVDSDEFNLNCFYCYEIFPLYKWLEFKEHIELQHNHKGKLNQKQQPQPMMIDVGQEPEPEPVAVNKSILRSQEINALNEQFQQNLKEKQIQNQKQQQPQPMMIDVAQEPPPPNTTILKSPHINGIKVKSAKDLNMKISPTKAETDIKVKEKLSPKCEAMSSPGKLSKDNSNKERTMPRKSPLLKNPACYINLNESSNKSTPTTTNTNPQLNRSAELSTQPIVEDNLNQSEEFIDLTSEYRSDDFNAGSVEEIISIGDDEDEENEFDEIIENFSKEFQVKNEKNENALNTETQTATTTATHIASPIASPIATPNLETLQNPTTKITVPIANDDAHQKLPNLPQLTIRKVEPVTPPTAAVETPQTASSSSSLKKAYIKLPTNLSIEEVLKTIPKPTTPQKSSTFLSPTKPRYFVVKKVVKPTETVPKVNLPIGTVITKLINAKANDDDDDMPSNDENEDEVPKPTNGCGILFGLTHREVVLQFLLKLQTFPELWRPQMKHDANINYNESIGALCKHLNDRFDLNIEDFEMRLSIQRVKDWYCRTLKNICLHNQNRNIIEPYKHTFPEYFKILNKFLTSDVHFTKNLLLSHDNKLSNSSMMDYPKWMIYKPGRTMTVEEEKEPKPVKKPVIKFKATILPDDDSSQNVIEFDADTLYGNESTDEENVQPPEKPKTKPTFKSTKVYCPLVPIVCDICNRNFKRNIDLRRHRVGHFPPKFQCSLCSQMFIHKHWAEKCSHGMKKKQFNVTTEDGLVPVAPTKIKSRVPKPPNFRKWMCEVCGVSYRSVGSLNAHKRDKHLNQRLKCVVCKFTAVTNYRIVQHQKKRHVVEPGTVEEVAKKSRARLDSKTPFTPEARQEFDWRREQRKNLNPGEIFYGCCKCRIIFETRKEKVLHNKLEHPIKDTTVICLLCHPEKMLLSNSNSVRRHYTDIHKVPWDEIDDLVKRTKPIFQLLTKDEIELLNSSVNYTELLNELLITKKLKLEPEQQQQPQPMKPEEEATQAIEMLANLSNYTNEVEEVEVEAKEEEFSHVDVAYMESSHEPEENVFVDGIIDHDYENAEDDNYKYEHNYNENQQYTNYQVGESNDNNDDQNNINVHNDDDPAPAPEHTEYEVLPQSNDQKVEVINGEDSYAIHYDGELIEESIVVEEYVDDDLIEEYTIEDYL